ncbi:MAG: hypothetical protein ACI9T7_003757 [Oleiphilaceae bacterium]
MTNTVRITAIILTFIFMKNSLPLLFISLINRSGFI